MRQTINPLALATCQPNLTVTVIRSHSCYLAKTSVQFQPGQRFDSAVFNREKWSRHRCQKWEGTLGNIAPGACPQMVRVSATFLDFQSATFFMPPVRCRRHTASAVPHCTLRALIVRPVSLAPRGGPRPIPGFEEVPRTSLPWDLGPSRPPFLRLDGLPEQCAVVFAVQRRNRARWLEVEGEVELICLGLSHLGGTTSGRVVIPIGKPAGGHMAARDISTYERLRVEARGYAGGEQICVALHDDRTRSTNGSKLQRLIVTQDWRWYSLSLTAFERLDLSRVCAVEFSSGAGVQRATIRRMEFE